MKILFVNKFLYPNGGSETYMLKLGKYLAEQGHEVQYFGMEHKDRCVGNNLNLYTENMDFHNSNALQKFKLSLKTIYSKEARQKMLAVLKDFKPDVVHLNNFNFQLTPSIIYAVNDYEKESGNRIKLFYTAHDYQLICPNHMMFNNNSICESCIGGNFTSCIKGRCIHDSMLKSIIGTAEAEIYNRKNTYDRIDTIICCSEFIKTKLDTNPIFKNKTIAIHNFIDKKIPDVVNKKDYILYFGRYDDEKGINVICECARRLPETQFVFAGRGSKEEIINSIPNIKNVGFKTGNELEALVREAKCTVYPSIWYENCPFSVMESISLGTPVIGADIGGIPELIDNGKTGYLFDAGNADKMIEAINKIESDKMSKYCLEKDFDTVEEYYDKLMLLYKGKNN